MLQLDECKIGNSSRFEKTLKVLLYHVENQQLDAYIQVH